MSDPATASNYAQVSIPSFTLVLAVDFDEKRVLGQAQLTARAAKPGGTLPSSVTLDVHNLRVLSVTAAEHCDSGQCGAHVLSFAITPFQAFGSALRIDTTPLSTLESACICINYVAGEGAALCWLTPEQTAGKAQPFLFTQGQACLNRTLFPSQDTPSSRSTWRATLVVPRRFAAVMSAPTSNAVSGDRGVGTELAEDSAELALLRRVAGEAGGAALPLAAADVHAFSAAMPHAVPAYLVALAVGDLRCADIGPRSRVWTEPVQLARAAHEFGHGGVTEAYVAAGERLFGPYRWGRYDLCVMPPSFPYGGMENPTMTFTTPALLAGDQSLTDVVAHEIAHSWTGNLVTNSTWQNFFLNEGFTMYLQRRITAVVHGADVTALEIVGGRALLRAMMRDYGAEHPLTRLTVPLADGVDPDDTYTEAPYEKGFAFVSYLRAAIEPLVAAAAAGGGDAAGAADAAFDAWLTAYTSKFAFASITPTDMLESYFDAFPALRGDWTRESWAAEEAAEAAAWWARPGTVPEDFSTVPPLPPYDPTTAPPDARGRRGLAYRSGFELVRWLHAPGWPPYYPPQPLAESLSSPAEACLAAWLGTGGGAGALPPPSAAGAADFAAWPTLQKLHFLDSALAALERADPRLTPAVLSGLDAAYGFGSSSNAEVRVRWCQLVGGAGYEPGFASIAAFLRTTGKLKYVTPVFRALTSPTAGAAAHGLAPSLFAAVRPSLHPAVQSRVEGVLQKARGGAGAS